MGNLLLSGERFNRWTVISVAAKHEPGIFVLCRCDCGKEFVVRFSMIRSGKSKQCKPCGHTKHGFVLRSEYQSWKAMKMRCSNRNYHAYHRYGGRGVTVCERWLASFENFIADMGSKPSPDFTIDRIDNNGNYEPSNCRWATVAIQAGNRG